MRQRSKVGLQLESLQVNQEAKQGVYFQTAEGELLGLQLNQISKANK